MSGYKYFSFCPTDGFEFYKTIEEAKERAKKNIKNHVRADGSWYLSVGCVCYGEIKGIATKNDVKPDDARELDYTCKYELKQPE